MPNYTSHHPTQENYDCSIWKAACSTVAAPIFFKPVKLSGGEEWCDGAIIGTGIGDTASVSNSVGNFLKSVIKIMTDSEDVADAFLKSDLGQQLQRDRQYLRFNVPQGMQTLRLDEWREVEKMKAVTTEHLSKHDVGNAVKSCARSLFDPDGTLARWYLVISIQHTTNPKID
ncbi:hypothetical protein B0T14DRAFT_567363 [Immersiella caudata]|uniref:Uncharacterized protein n=1 Tax=Immersiella caudata TaxID=314043 RepID=A0AA39WSD6_9PEZI|nr:hypothetical protein B0T14DRAFT_567363 [Immersiella caudata]